MKKQLLCIVLALALILPLALTACGEKTGSQADNTPAPAPTATTEPTPTPTPTPEPTPEPVGTGPVVEEFALGRMAKAGGTYVYYGKEVDRKFYYYIPSGFDGTPLPLMLTLHGSASNALMQLTDSSWHKYAEEYGVIIVAPESTAIHSNGQLSSSGKLLYEIGQSEMKYLRWGALTSDPCVGMGVDDVAYLCDLVDLFVNAGYADPKRVYSSGLSHGAFMSLRLAIERPDVFAGVGIVAGELSPSFEDIPMTEKVKVVFFHGTEDPVVPFGGMTMSGYKYTYSVDDTAAWFLEQYGMADDPEVTALPDTDPEDGTTVTRYAYKDADGEAWVVKYVIEGGGHTWPGGTQYSPVDAIGRLCTDISATEVMWDELKDVAKP